MTLTAIDGLDILFDGHHADCLLCGATVTATDANRCESCSVPLSAMDVLTAMERRLHALWIEIETSTTDAGRTLAHAAWLNMAIRLQNVTAEIAADMAFDAWADDAI